MTDVPEPFGPESKIYVRYPGAHASPSAAPSGSIVPDPVNPHVSAGRPPAPESLPVGTDPPVYKFEPPNHDDNDWDVDEFIAVATGRAPIEPVGTDSARAEAERRYKPTFRYDTQHIRKREVFIAGAEWARAEERKARGE